MINKKLRVAFIQGRPHGHLTHMEYAKSINADFYFVDSKIRYHDVQNSSPIRKYLSWIFSALAFPLKKYDVIFTEEPYFSVGLMRWLGLLKKQQILISLEATHTLYFLKANKYSASTIKANRYLLTAYDAFICVGQFQKKLLQNMLEKDNPVPIYTVFNGVSIDRFNKLNAISPDITSHNMVFIGDVPNEGRIWYKGLDLMLKAFEDAKNLIPKLTFTVVGDYLPGQIDELLNTYCPTSSSSITFTGNINDIDTYLARAGLYLHISRGEAWGISINEAMAAGIVPIVSDCTGAMEVVEQIDKRLICTLNADVVTQKILWFFSLSQDEKLQMSNQCKELIKDKYTEDKAVECFRKTFYKVVDNLK